MTTVDGKGSDGEVVMKRKCLRRGVRSKREKSFLLGDVVFFVPCPETHLARKPLTPLWLSGWRGAKIRDKPVANDKLGIFQFLPPASFLLPLIID